MFCKVVFDVPLDRDFDYRVPEGLSPRVKPGIRVVASLGPRRAVGLITAVEQQTAFSSGKIKEIEDVLDEKPVFGSDLFELAGFIQKEWGGAIGQILFSLIPPQPYFKMTDCTVPPSYTARLGDFKLTLSQQNAWNFLSGLPAYEYQPILLRGPAGSGKTELVLRIAAQTLQNYGQILITVPDIVAAKEFISRACARFGEQYVFCWHSKMLLSQKKKYFSAVANGNPCVVIAMRSGGLLPFKNLRLAVMLQEEDENYKQEENKPYYHLRDLLLFRGKMHGSTVLFVSQTPSMEMLKRVQDGNVKELVLTEKIAGLDFKPQVKITDKKSEKSNYLSSFLIEEISQNILRREPVLLILNRRGYSNAYYCLNCGEYARCKKCGAILSREKTAEKGDILVCKKCGASEGLEQICPKCQNRIFKSRGSGTQKIVNEVQKLFPQARIVRLDSDTLKTKSGQGHLAAQAITAGEADILIGTRLAVNAGRGGKITLFGVLDADLELDSPDFRAGEKFGQMLFTLLARAACVRGGRLIVQANGKDIYPFEFLEQGDWAGAARQELALRKAFGYPPFIRLVKVTLMNKDLKELEAQTERLKALFKGCAEEIAGPVLCSKKTDKIKKQYLLFKLTEEQYFPAVKILNRLAADKSYSFKLIADPYDFY